VELSRRKACDAMNEKPRSDNFRHRILVCAMYTVAFQILLGVMVAGTMYGRGPLVLLFLIPMTVIAYLWLFQNAIRFELWPAAIMFGTFFMFLVILAVGEIGNRIRNQSLASPSKQVEAHNP
jgi:hypothetical protein